MGFFSDRKRARDETDIKDKTLDNEAKSRRVKIRSEVVATDFECFRCNVPKKAKLRYEWSTSEGTKIVCNGCHGFLCSQSKNTNPEKKRSNKRAKRTNKKNQEQPKKESDSCSIPDWAFD